MNGMSEEPETRAFLRQKISKLAIERKVNRDKMRQVESSLRAWGNEEDERDLMHLQNIDTDIGHRIAEFTDQYTAKLIEKEVEMLTSLEGVTKIAPKGRQ
jgi:hypothetical protein